MDYDEFQLQMVLGTIRSTADMQAHIKITKDLKLLNWALVHKRVPVREAAVENLSCPLGEVLHVCFFDTRKGPKEAARKVLQDKRRHEFADLLKVMNDFPQLSFPGLKG